MSHFYYALQGDQAQAVHRPAVETAASDCVFLKRIRRLVHYLEIERSRKSSNQKGFDIEDRKGVDRTQTLRNPLKRRLQSCEEP